MESWKRIMDDKDEWRRIVEDVQSLETTKAVQDAIYAVY